jgi:hypothetical protein
MVQVTKKQSSSARRYFEAAVPQSIWIMIHITADGKEKQTIKSRYSYGGIYPVQKRKCLDNDQASLHSSSSEEESVNNTSDREKRHYPISILRPSSYYGAPSLNDLTNGTEYLADRERLANKRKSNQSESARSKRVRLNPKYYNHECVHF